MTTHEERKRVLKKESKGEVVGEFARFLIDNAENRVIAVSDLPDLVIDFIEKELEE